MRALHVALALAGSLLVGLGCASDPASQPEVTVPLAVRVDFPEVRPAGLGRGLTITRVRAHAIEIRGEEMIPRAEGETPVAPTDTQFRLVLRVPPAEDYLIRVDAIGPLGEPVDGATEGGLFAGETRTGPVSRDAPAEVVVDLTGFVTTPEVRITPDVPCDVYEVTWPALGGAASYIVRERDLVDGGVVSIPTTELALQRPWPGGPGMTNAFASYRVNGLLDGGVPGPTSDSVNVAIPVFPIEDLCWSPAFGTGVGGAGVQGDGGFLLSARTVDDELVVGGSNITDAGTVSVSGIAAWNGTRWRAFGTTFTFDDQVRALAEFQGQVVAAGVFTAAGNNIATWNGTVWQPLGGGVGGPVNALVEYEGRLIVGGSFRSAGGALITPTLAAWNGTGWEAFPPPLVGCTFAEVFSLAVHDGWLLVGGLFSDDCQTFVYLYAYRDGTWNALTPPAQAAVGALVVHEGDLIAGAAGFTERYTPGPGYLGGSWRTLGSGSIDAQVEDLAVHRGVLYGCGSAFPGSIAAYMPGTDTWAPLGSGVFGDGRALAVFGDRLHVVGEFTFAGSFPSSLIARWER